MGLEPQPISVPSQNTPRLQFRETDRDHTKQSIPVPEKNRGLNTNKGNGVDDGTRTHDDRDHNPGLYQLSYVHHGGAYFNLRQPNWRARQDSNLQPSA